MDQRYKIDKVKLSITNVDEAAGLIIKEAKNKRPVYVCVTNVRTTYIGNHNEQYREILNNSFLTLPDGKPLEWYARAAKINRAKKTSGPDLFENICRKTENTGLTHFLFGSTPEVIKKMQVNIKRKYPNLKIVGAVSPPFKPVEELATDEIVEQVNRLKPSFFWVGLGAPKQEQFIHLIKDRIKSSIMIGVGLVFEYQAGTVKRAPKWMQKNGFEWLYRHVQQPKMINYKNYVRNFSILPLIFKAAIKAK